MKKYKLLYVFLKGVASFCFYCVKLHLNYKIDGIINYLLPFSLPLSQNVVHGLGVCTAGAKHIVILLIVLTLFCAYFKYRNDTPESQVYQYLLTSFEKDDRERHLLIHWYVLLLLVHTYWEKDLWKSEESTSWPVLVVFVLLLWLGWIVTLVAVDGALCILEFFTLLVKV